jgi:hypothetical protein
VQRSSGKSAIRLSPLSALAEPPNLIRLKLELVKRWPSTSLLDMLKEVDLRIHFNEQFVTAGAREQLDRMTLQKRLLLCLHALGTNTGLKRMSGGENSQSNKDLLYVHRHFHRPPIDQCLVSGPRADHQTGRLLEACSCWLDGRSLCL